GGRGLPGKLAAGHQGDARIGIVLHLQADGGLYRVAEPDAILGKDIGEIQGACARLPGQGVGGVDAVYDLVLLDTVADAPDDAVPVRQPEIVLQLQIIDVEI